jgi:hypothetical protein
MTASRHGDSLTVARVHLEFGGVIPTIPLLDRISAALDADLIVEIAPHAAQHSAQLPTSGRPFP